MNEIIKKPYEISLWDEETVYVITTTGYEADRYETTVLPENYVEDVSPGIPGDSDECEACQSEELIPCYVVGEGSCVTGCQSSCQTSCLLAAQSGECSDINERCPNNLSTTCPIQGIEPDDCETTCEIYTCQTCQGTCLTCQTDCQLTSCQASCQTLCETCQTVCQTSGSCQSACESASQDSCQTCMTDCEECEVLCLNGQCASGCQTACESDSCQAICQDCQASCQVTCQTCMTDCEECEDLCMNCQGTYQDLCCEIDCQVNCQVICQSECQSYIACQATCQAMYESGCQTGCQVGVSCQSSCELGVVCQNSCQTGAAACQSSCQTDCEGVCQSHCQSGCEILCQSCETSAQQGTEAQNYSLRSIAVPDYLESTQPTYKVLNRYTREVKVATIGSSTMDNPIRAFNPKLVQNVNGSNTLTFQIYSKYYDEEAEEFKDNPFINLLVNERKVKLYYEDQWYEFVIKKIQENSENKTFSYTCKDLYINELGKTGYDVELAIELENNMGTVTELGDKVLEGSDWYVDKVNSDIIKQKNKESLYVCELPSDITATIIDDFAYKENIYKKGQEITLAAGTVIYVFYSSFVNKEKPIQFLYHNSTSYDDGFVSDEDGFIINSPNYEAEVPDLFFDYNANTYISSVFFGEKIVAKPITKYLSEIDKYCTLYVDEEGQKYYGYSETEYASIAKIQNLLTNSNEFASASGWVGVSTASASSTVSLSNIIGKDNSGKEVVYKSLRLNFSSVGKIINTGFYDNRKVIGNLVAGDEFIIALDAYEAKDSNGAPVSGAITGAEVVFSTSSNKEEETLINFSEYSDSKLAGYKLFKGVCKNSVSYEKLLTYDFKFYLKGTGEVEIADAKLFRKVVGANGQIIVPDLESSINSIIRVKYYFFPTYLIDGVVPQKIFGVEDLEFSTVCYEEELGTSGYTAVRSENFEKIRSITASKSNRFNLIQELCETFECWAKLSIKHTSRGFVEYSYAKTEDKKAIEGKTYYRHIGSGLRDRDFRIATQDEICEYHLVDKSVNQVSKTVTYYKKKGSEYEELLFNEGNFKNTNDNPLLEPVWEFYPSDEYYIRTDFEKYEIYEKRTEKLVTFKRFIGQENQAGFRYGINLKSIQREVNSEQIATKVIVEPNVNEFAENGSCSIQTSRLNPTGESVLYNFDYYIHHKLLTRQEVNDDLYGANGGIGLYAKLRKWNNQIKEPIEEAAQIANTINVLTSRKMSYKSIVDNAQAAYQDAIDEMMVSGGLTFQEAVDGVRSEDKGDFINNLITKRNEATSTIARYTTILDNTNKLLADYNNRHAALTHELNQIAKKKKALMTEFYKKYSRFIQEGTWTSSDHIDADDYFLDAQQVSYTSSRPQVTYSINVLEISQVEGFEPYHFSIGDKTYIEDTDFFGWDDYGRPYKEEIVVSEVTYELDEPSKNTIKVQNYKTQFEDLFQRIAAATQSLQYHEGEYRRAANAINADGTINSSLLKNSLKNNELLIKNAKDESVVWDETGITITNFLNPNNIVRLVSGGIVLTSDGGKNWTTGITGEGINANVITTGRLDTNRIRIFNAEQQTFEWNAKGLSAFYQENDNAPINYDKYIRFDRYGLYGMIGDTGEIADIQSEEDVINHSYFSLTWKGLHINIPDQQEMDVITIGKNKSNGKPYFSVDNKGNLYAQNAEIYGAIYANEGVFNGTVYAEAGVFNGTIQATSGFFQNVDLRNMLKVYSTQLGDYVGYIGGGTGQDPDGNTTYGVALSYGVGTDKVSIDTESPYLLVAEGGVRMTTSGTDKVKASVYVATIKGKSQVVMIRGDYKITITEAGIIASCENPKKSRNLLDDGYAVFA